MTDTLADDLLYLRTEAFEFLLSLNPHATSHSTIAEHFCDRDCGPDWVSEEQRAEAYRTGRFVEGQVYPNGSVGFFLIAGTDVGDVVARCAKACREDRASWDATVPASGRISRAFTPCDLPPAEEAK